MSNTDFENLREHAQRGDYTNAHLARRVQELEKALDAAQDDAARLRAALQAVEFVYDDVCGYCPWCNANDKDRIIGDDNYVIQHKPDCQFRAALAQTSEVKHGA